MGTKAVTATAEIDPWEIVDHEPPAVAPASPEFASSSIAPALPAEKMTPAQLKYNIAHIKADLKDGEWKNASLLCQRCLNLVRGDRQLESDFYSLLGQAFEGQGIVEGARFAREQSTILNDKACNAAREQYREHMNKYEWQLAVELCDKWIAKAERYLVPVFYFMKADALFRLRKYDEAQQATKTAYAINAGPSAN